MKQARLFWNILKRCQGEKIILGFLASYFLGALIFLVWEPAITTYGEGLWYAFVCCTTIGFGDFAAVTTVGRLVTMFLTLYEILVVALFSGVVVSHYMEVIHRREKYTATVFIDRLEHLSELSPQELKDLEERVRTIKAKIIEE